ncbi:MAG: hypothetical protein OI74_07970 [Gammaproteobacteria bacterium (ex Lamellibrachia satsuma)]|nr:MAG: hypothetical protein HPY30_04055 [Gammaproteobacteria bacterium (ex Lamellibrachia satsuma)]RRS33403.1 MAG: hypothetical protein OI74_07970 [Gammaproteobacteria bacterium (ex Lamellibrachia satsuma)]RRS35056.1 MAG: hypothetical protein NV67_11600 [Gammaproteobacteria bacterium (ex Lamellibrachia satsuma)]
MQKHIKIAGVNPESFDQLGGKLVSLCSDYAGLENEIKIVVAFSDRDPGRGNAILWLTKYFGVFPMEIGGPDGELDLHDLTGFSRHQHLTLFVRGSGK